MNENNTTETGPVPVPSPADEVRGLNSPSVRIDEAAWAAPTVVAGLNDLDFPEETPAPEVKAKIVPQRIVSQQNVEYTDSVSKPFTDKAPFDPEQETLDLPSDYLENVSQMIEAAPNIQLDGSEQGAKWAEVLRNGMTMAPLEGMFRSSLEDPDSIWVQKIDSPAGPLQATTPTINMPGAEVVSGERGLITMLNYLGMGSVFRVPLWHSGFWLALKAPSEGALLELHRANIADKIRLGRESYGLAFSNNSSYTAERLINLALTHIHSSNFLLPAPAPGEAPKDLTDYLTIHDLYTVVWAMACAIWNNGFQYRRACTHNAEKCQHVHEEKLNVTKLQWVNKKAFTPHQIQHMSQTAANSVDETAVLRYRAEMLKGQNRRIVINEGEDYEITMQLRVPTIRQHIAAGHAWVGEIADMVSGALGEDANLNTRNNYIVTRGKATSMRQFLHWVESVTIREKTMVEQKSLEKLFDRLSANDHIRTKFLEAVNKYSQDTAVSVIGIPDYECPVCQGSQNPEHTAAAGTHILPLDVYQTFFTLVVQRIGRIGDRY